MSHGRPDSETLKLVKTLDLGVQEAFGSAPARVDGLLATAESFFSVHCERGCGSCKPVDEAHCGAGCVQLGRSLPPGRWHLFSTGPEA